MSRRGNLIRPSYVLIAWFFVLAVILIAGLEPLRFHPDNGAHWLQDRNGIAFDNRGLAYTNERFNQSLRSSDLQPGSSCTIELLIAPRQTSTDYVARILSDDDTGHSPNFLLAQWDSHLILRARFWTAGTSVGRVREVSVANVFHRGELSHIAITSAPMATQIYINGATALSVAGGLDVERFTGHLLLGSAGTGDDAWFGDVLGLALHDRSLSRGEIQEHAQNWRLRTPPMDAGTTALYAFSERTGERVSNRAMPGRFLEIPHRLTTIHRNILQWNLRLTKSGLLDIVLNVLGFIPFGLLTAASLRQALHWPKRRSAIIAVVSAALLSFGIEFVQAYLPGRDSSTTDLVMNTVGAGLGALLWMNWAREKLLGVS